LNKFLHFEAEVSNPVLETDSRQVEKNRINNKRAQAGGTTLHNAWSKREGVTITLVTDLSAKRDVT
jgi:hypothetical protein